MNKYENRKEDEESPSERMFGLEHRGPDRVVETPYILGDIEDLNELPTLLGPKTYTKAKLTREDIVQRIESDPRKTNVQWAEEWGCSRERVRQLREQFGLNSVREFNLELFKVKNALFKLLTIGIPAKLKLVFKIKGTSVLL